MARWFKACQMVIRGISGEPVIRAISSSSSTTPGSAIKARQSGSNAANSEAIRHPRLHAWLLMAWVISSSMASFTSYTPPGMGFSNPPRPTMASNSKGIPFSFKASITKFLRNSNWSMTRGKWESSPTEWRMLRTKSGVVSSYTAIFVEVEPGLIARILII